MLRFRQLLDIELEEIWLEFWIPYGRTEVPIAVADENLLGFLSITDDSTRDSGRGPSTGNLSEMTAHQSFTEAARRAGKTVIAFNSDSAAAFTAAHHLAKDALQAGTQSVTLLQTAPDPTQPRPSRNTAEALPEGQVTLVTHDRKDSPSTKVGELEGGAEISINEQFFSADLRCVVSSVGVNPFWGFSGGPSSILVGLGSENTIKACLSSSLRTARLPGVLSGNPTYEAILSATKTVGIGLAVHVVEDFDGRVAGMFTGDFQQTFEDACALVSGTRRPRLRRKADIVIMSPGGAPWDRTLFEAAPSALMAAAVCKDHGMLVLVAECADGLGAFSKAELEIRDPKKRVSSRKAFSLERMVQNSFQKMCAEHRTYLVSTLPEYHATTYEILSAKSVGNALQRASRHVEKDASVAIVPYGSVTAPIVEQS